jgi:SAM-dependent methyltransferase
MLGLVPDPVANDAFGAALRACHDAGARPGIVFETVERDDGFISAADTARYFAPVEDWPTLEHQAYEEFTGRVLDVGCGAGRHASVLTAAGVDVIGVDHSPGAIEVARARGVDARLGGASALPAGIAWDSLAIPSTLLGKPDLLPATVSTVTRPVGVPIEPVISVMN